MHRRRSNSFDFQFILFDIFCIVYQILLKVYSTFYEEDLLMLYFELFRIDIDMATFSKIDTFAKFWHNLKIPLFLRNDK